MIIESEFPLSTQDRQAIKIYYSRISGRELNVSYLDSSRIQAVAVARKCTIRAKELENVYETKLHVAYGAYAPLFRNVRRLCGQFGMQFTAR